MSERKMFANKNKGRMSALDALVKALWKPATKSKWPELTFRELASRASEFVGYELKQPTVRSYVYKNPSIFRRASDKTMRPRWHLTASVRKG